MVRVNPDPAYGLKYRPQGRFFASRCLPAPWQEKPAIGGGQKKRLAAIPGQVPPSQSHPFRLAALCSVLSVDRGYTPRAASPLSWTAHYAKQRESDDTNNQHPLTDSTVYCDITWITASSCHTGTVNLLYRSSGTGRCHRTLPGLRNLSDIAHRLDIVLKN